MSAGVAAASQSLDLFSLGRAAQATARDATGGRGLFACWRRLLPTGLWQGSASAVSAFVEEMDLGALGGLSCLRSGQSREAFGRARWYSSLTAWASARS